jgi:prophage regulatory protein
MSVERLLSRRQLRAVTGMSLATIDRRIRDGGFPEPLKISKRRVAWPESVILRWMDELAAISAVDEPPDTRKDNEAATTIFVSIPKSLKDRMDHGTRLLGFSTNQLVRLGIERELDVRVPRVP